MTDRWNFNYRALLEYVDTHDGNLPEMKEKYTFEGTVLPLGHWVGCQVGRINGAKGPNALRDDERELLEQIPAFLLRIEDQFVDESYYARAIAYYCNHIDNGRLPSINIDTWVFYDQGHTNITRNMTGRYCDKMKVKFMQGRLGDEAQLVLSGVKAWVEWAEDPLKDDKQRLEFNARAVAAFYLVHGRLPTDREEWDFSHADINGTVAGDWWKSQIQKYRNRMNVNAVVRGKSEIMTDEQDRQLDEWIGEPWQKWKDDEDIILAILRYKDLQGDAWDGTVRESFVVPKGGEERSEQWHKLWGVELGQLASSVSSGARVLDNPTKRLTTAGFIFQKKPPGQKVDFPSSQWGWDLQYRALLDYVDKHDGNLPKEDDRYTFEGTVLSLGNWVSGQVGRYNGRKGHIALRDDQRELLEQIPAFRSRVEKRFVDDLFTARAVVYYCSHISNGRLPGQGDRWTFYDQGHTNITWNMNHEKCRTLKAKFKQGRLSDEAQLVLRRVKAWVEWMEDPLRDDSTRYEFNARAVAYFYQVHGRFPNGKEEWDFSHAGVNGTVRGVWIDSQYRRYRNRITMAQLSQWQEMYMTDEQDRQLDEWIGEPWKKWKENEDIILAILQYKELQGDAWDGTVSESFVVPKGGEDGREQWHERLWGMELGQIASSIGSGARVLDHPTRRLVQAGFLFRNRIRTTPSRGQDARWDLHYRALRDYVDTHDGNLPKQSEKYAFEGEGQLQVGIWVSSQLGRIKGSKGHAALRDDQRELLEQIPAFRRRIANRFLNDA